MTTARDLTQQAPASQELRAGSRIRLAAALGVAGAVLSFVGWALMLSNPASGTTRWYAGNSVGELAMAGTTILVLGMFAARETGVGATGRSFLALWALGQVILLTGGIQSLITSSQDTILFPIGGITAGLASLVASIFIACNKRLKGSLRRWAPLIYTIGGWITVFFQGDQHTLKVNLADLTNNVLMLLLAGAFYAGVRRAGARQER
jgi:hypothetical protein